MRVGPGFLVHEARSTRKRQKRRDAFASLPFADSWDRGAASAVLSDAGQYIYILKFLSTRTYLLSFSINHVVSVWVYLYTHIKIL